MKYFWSVRSSSLLPTRSTLYIVSVKFIVGENEISGFKIFIQKIKDEKFLLAFFLMFLKTHCSRNTGLGFGNFKFGPGEYF